MRIFIPGIGNRNARRRPKRTADYGINAAGSLKSEACAHGPRHAAVLRPDFFASFQLLLRIFAAAPRVHLGLPARAPTPTLTLT